MNTNVTDIRSLVEWEVTFEDGHNFSTTSYPERRVHIITISTRSMPDPHRFMSIQHEFAHAYLCERVSQHFSTQRLRGVPAALELTFKTLVNIASDWYVSGVLHKFLSNLFSQYIRECFHERISIVRNDDIEVTKYALLIALAKYFEIERNTPHLSQVESNIVRALLDSNPHRPTIASLESLINRILKNVEFRFPGANLSIQVNLSRDSNVLTCHSPR